MIRIGQVSSKEIRELKMWSIGESDWMDNSRWEGGEVFYSQEYDRYCILVVKDSQYYRMWLKDNPLKF